MPYLSFQNKGKKRRFIFVFLLSVIICLVFFINWKKELLLPVNVISYTCEGNTVTSEHHFNEKIWLHRVNSIEKMKKFQDQYKGLEIDIQYHTSKDFFYVSHDTDSTINLSLEDIFDAVTDISNHYFWLDFKNLDKENQFASLQKLSDITEKYHLFPYNIIVESHDPLLLTDFTEYGFQTSYYMPWVKPYEDSKESMLQMAKEIDENLRNSKINYISGSYDQYVFMNAYFPKAQKLIWYVRNKPLKVSYLKKKLTKDDSVKVILLSDD